MIICPLDNNYTAFVRPAVVPGGRRERRRNPVGKMDTAAIDSDGDGVVYSGGLFANRDHAVVVVAGGDGVGLLDVEASFRVIEGLCVKLLTERGPLLDVDLP